MSIFRKWCKRIITNQVRSVYFMIFMLKTHLLSWSFQFKRRPKANWSDVRSFLIRWNLNYSSLLVSCAFWQTSLLKSGANFGKKIVFDWRSLSRKWAVLTISCNVGLVELSFEKRKNMLATATRNSPHFLQVSSFCIDGWNLDFSKPRWITPTTVRWPWSFSSDPLSCWARVTPLTFSRC